MLNQYWMDAHRAGKVKLLEMVWDHLVDAERIPPPQRITEMFCMRLQKGVSSAALSCFMKFGASGPQLSSRKYWSNFFVENGDMFEKGTLNELVRQVSILLARSENLALQHVMDKCAGFLRTQRTSRELQSMSSA